MVNYETGMKSSETDFISTTDNFFFYKWHPSTETLTGKTVWSVRGLCWKINIIWSLSIRIYWLAYELFSPPVWVLGYIYIYIYREREREREFDRNIPYISNCHLCGTYELRQVVMVTPLCSHIAILFFR